MCDLDATGTPSIFKKIRSVAAVWLFAVPVNFLFLLFSFFRIGYYETQIRVVCGRIFETAARCIYYLGLNLSNGSRRARRWKGNVLMMPLAPPRITFSF
jgi:uncharacterized membrane-anchored protein YitT (DUF2179 family)